MITFEDLYDAYLVTRRNKRRSADSVHFEIHWQRNLCQLYEDINNRNIRPTAYTFITTRPRPREVFACDMSMRIIHHYIDIRLRPLIEQRLTNRTFNNRVGYGQNVAINQVIEDIYDVSGGFTRDAWIFKMDLSGYFPNASQDIVCNQLVSLTQESYVGQDKDELIYLIQHSIFSYPHLHCYRKSPMWKWSMIPDSKSLFKKPAGVGGAIGHLIWQNAMNYYLNDLDHWLTGLPIYNVTQALPAAKKLPNPPELPGLHYVRFVDDMVIVTDNKEAMLAFIPQIRARLAEYGCTLHPKKFYCQHYTKGVEFIGAHIKKDHVMLDQRTVHHAEQSIRRLNRCAREGKIKDLLASVNSYLGICKTRNGHRVALQLVAQINPAWWSFVHFNKQRTCLEANEGFKTTQRLIRKYHLNPKIYDKRRKKSTAQRAARGGAPAGGVPQFN